MWKIVAAPCQYISLFHSQFCHSLTGYVEFYNKNLFINYTLNPFNINVDSDFSTPKLAKCIMTGIKIAVDNEREEILT